MVIVPIILDPEVLKVAEYVYQERLSKPYTEVGRNGNTIIKPLMPLVLQAQGIICNDLSR